MEVLDMEWNKKMAASLFLRFKAIWPQKMDSVFNTPEMIEVFIIEWYEGLKGIDVTLMKNSINYCRANLEWPPSIAEFRKICEKVGGTPDFEEAFQKALKQEFSHPAIEKAYWEIGSWDFKHGYDADLRKRFKVAYDKHLNLLRSNKENSKKIEHNPINQLEE